MMLVRQFRTRALNTISIILLIGMVCLLIYQNNFLKNCIPPSVIPSIITAAVSSSGDDIDITTSIPEASPDYEYEPSTTPDYNYKRQEVLKDACEGREMTKFPYETGNPNATHHEFFKYIDANVFFCSPPKSGSTSLDNYIVEMLNLTDGNTSINWASIAHFAHRKNVKSLEQFENFTGVTFMIARNPLDRLLSCWYDKFSGLKEKQENAINKLWGPIICQHFPNFTHSTIGEAKKIPAYLDHYNKTYCQPTMEQFFRFVANGSAFLVLEGQQSAEYLRTFHHWSSISGQCYPCEIKYTFLMHTETLDNDIPLAFRTANSSLKLPEPKRKNLAAKTSDSLELQLARELPISLIREALEWYRDDYQLFGYSLMDDLFKLFGDFDSEVDSIVRKRRRRRR